MYSVLSGDVKDVGRAWLQRFEVSPAGIHFYFYLYELGSYAEVGEVVAVQGRGNWRVLGEAVTSVSFHATCVATAVAALASSQQLV